jgi:DNA-3-methyladenine glycosylase I
MVTDRARCWGDEDPQMARYHDEEWGVPVHDDQALFEHLILDAFQAGLSWSLILGKREAFRAAFDGFDPEKVSEYGESDVARLMGDAGIVRNQGKIRAAIHNARMVRRIQVEFGSFDDYIWGFTGHRTLRGPRAESWEEVPNTSPEAEAMSRDLKKRGLKFVGPTICYAFMQAVGMVDDHQVGCFRYQEHDAG